MISSILLLIGSAHDRAAIKVIIRPITVTFTGSGQLP
ncbi:hypothetical protein MGSAQ_000513 [marine sediment metagenome]|uniref:Uncharacterized protein n=1 Tax=marine sediment metagenome TaxID=412755 RepID=A0A1B6NYB4_9ZZZZ